MMADIYYFSKKQDLFKHLFHNNISNANLILFSPLPDLVSVYNDPINILKEHPISKSKINYLSNEILNSHNYLAPSIYLKMINNITWVLPQWASNNHIKNIYWQDNIEKNFYFLDENLPSYKYKEGHKQEINNYNILFNSNNNSFVSSSFVEDTLSINIQKEKISDNYININKVDLENLSNININLPSIALISFDFFASTGYNMFNLELPSPTLDEIKNIISKIISFLSSLNNHLKMICFVQNPNYVIDDLITPIWKYISSELSSNNIYAEPILGPFYYSDKIILELLNLIELIKANFLNDPRNQNVSDQTKTKAFLDEIFEFKFNVISAPLYNLSFNNAKTSVNNSTKKIKRNDYEHYLKLLGSLELKNLQDKLISFINIQSDFNQTKDSLKAGFDILIYEIQNFIRNSSINKNTSGVRNVSNEFAKLKERDDKLIERTMNEINEHINKLGKLFE